MTLSDASGDEDDNTITSFTYAGSASLVASAAFVIATVAAL
jgi:hypothetical protein